MKITLAGVPGSGKSTLRNLLADHYDLKTKGTGDFMRSIAQKYGYNDITQFLVKYVSTHPEIDHEVDENQKKYGQENNDFVLDAHLGFLFVPNSIKIFLQCNPEVMAQRIFGAKRETEAAQDLQATMEANQKRVDTMKKNFKKLYGVDIHAETNFDFVIDTSHLSTKEVFEKTADYIDTRSKQEASIS